MKVVFFEDVEGTAQVGDVKEVKNGFARNFLLPRALAGAATTENLFRAKALAEHETRRQAKLDEEWAPAVARLAEYTLSIPARVGESGRLFGSVTSRDIAEGLTAFAGRDIESRMIQLPDPLRELGAHTVSVKLTRSTIVDVNVEVVPDEQSRSIVARLEAERAEREERERRMEEAALYRARRDRGEIRDEEETASDTADEAEDDGGDDSED